MIHHLNRIILFIDLAFLVSQSAAVQWVSDGDGHISGYDTTIYLAVKYRPVCGTLPLTANNWQTPFMETDTCYTSMAAYRSTGETFALYDLKGVLQPASTPIGDGVALCMCFSLQQAVSAGKYGDLCLEVGPTGEQPLSRGNAIGSFQLGTKGLPQCSALVNTSSDTPSSTEGTTPVTSSVVSTPQSSSTGTPGTANSTSTPGGPIAVGIWLPIVISAIVGATGIYYKRKQYLASKARLNAPFNQG